ncbi:hypothetical protein BLA6860_07581 [Burkholderia lata]|uniref:MBL fold metallo-hydrolase n=1 Tax=Burkholderia lata (strain ATCC 17760 / DSM 23089 / LMG 22485 / NCIMB 9086 / R18194 / 383) TaxID=482957 RepID=UPI0014545C1B|nr:MBL fold metallo-hydrolase [Burkholderia lata]VWC48232.1 hypothetical protein BLA6860_07581 [Burkholderia lata]
MFYSVDRIQFSIGQGGFHSTVVHYRRERFSVVIDCGGGSKETRQPLIETFTGGVPTEHDILAISHLDRDHINGVPELTQSAQFRYVFLPHVDESAYARWMTTRLAFEVEEAEAGSIALALDVVTGLYGGRYGRPVIVRGPDPIDPRDLREEVRFPERGAGNPLLPDDLRDLLDGAGAGLPSTTSIGLEDIDWVFRFYSYEWTEPDQLNKIWMHPFFDDLTTAIDALVNNPERPGVAQGIIDRLEDKIPADHANGAIFALTGKETSFERAISVKRLLGEVYERTPGLADYNDASMCVYSGPVQRGTSRPLNWFRRYVQTTVDGAAWARSRAARDIRSVGWIHTGDLNLDNDTKLAKFLRHYDAELRTASVLVLPHHGSLRSYGGDLGRLVTLTQYLDDQPLFLAPALPTGHYRHPDASVMEQCRKLGFAHIVDDKRATIFQESVRAMHL